MASKVSLLLALLLAPALIPAASAAEGNPETRVVFTRCMIYYQFNSPNGRSSSKLVEFRSDTEYTWPGKGKGILGKLGIFSYSDLVPTLETRAKMEESKVRLASKCAELEVKHANQNLQCSEASCTPADH